MRLEQCAQSFVQRTIASRGALAMLYGRDFKQYIKKSEVHFPNLPFSYMEALSLSFCHQNVVLFLDVIVAKYKLDPVCLLRCTPIYIYCHFVPVFFMSYLGVIMK